MAVLRSLLLLALFAAPIASQEVAQKHAPEAEAQEAAVKSAQLEDFVVDEQSQPSTTHRLQPSTTHRLSEEERAELKREKAQKEFVSASAQARSAQKHGQQVVAELQALFLDFKAKAKNRTEIQVLSKEAESHAEEAVGQRRLQLLSRFSAALEDLAGLQNATREELEVAAEKVQRASKDIKKLDKEKAKLLRKTPHNLYKQVKKNAKQQQKDAQKSAHAALRWAHHAESAGRKAGQDESTYEGAYQTAERDSEELSQDAEQFSERAEGLAEQFFEKAENALESRSDEINDAAELAHEKRLEQMAKILTRVAARSPAAPAASFLASSTETQASFFMPLCLLMTAMVAYGVLHLRKPAPPVLNQSILG